MSDVSALKSDFSEPIRALLFCNRNCRSIGTFSPAKARDKNGGTNREQDTDRNNDHIS